MAASKEAYVYLLIAQHNADIWMKDKEGKTVFDLPKSELTKEMLEAAKTADEKLLKELSGKISGKQWER